MATANISASYNKLLADLFVLHMKTKNFHWHITGPQFREYYLLLGEQAEQIYAATDRVGERVIKVGGRTLRSLQHVARLARLEGNDAEQVAPHEMLRELFEDNKKLLDYMRDAHETSLSFDDVAGTKLLEELIDQAEKRVWFLHASLAERE